jgi:mRNA-degrading endonuclease toxin of MazEF toxin-antitoxin module
MSLTPVKSPQRGEIWWGHFDMDAPDKRRPAVIVSPNGRNSHPRAQTVLAVPLSTSIHKQGLQNLPLRAGETGLREDSVAWADNVTTVRKDQLIEPVSGHRRLTETQICRLASLVRIAMGCVD